jgi:hypothetical protein
MAEGDEALLRPEDDDFHRINDDPWLTEGSWWCFFVPERRLDGWIYHLSRPNMGLAAGGVWVFDHTATSWDELPYYCHMSHQLLAPDADLRDHTWADGVHLRTLEPLRRYQMTYADGDAISFDLTYDALTDPWVSTQGEPATPQRWEEPTHVTGELVLRGERIPVDSIAFRDHSWSARPERLFGVGVVPGRTTAEWASAAPAYVFGTASAQTGFFAMGGKGYLLLDGKRVAVPEVTQRVERDPSTGHISRLTVTGADDDGRALDVTGVPLATMSMPLTASVAGIWNYFMEWQLAGETFYGEIQDVWPLSAWSSYRREAREGATSG